MIKNILALTVANIKSIDLSLSSSDKKSNSKLKKVLAGVFLAFIAIYLLSFLTIFAWIVSKTFYEALLPINLTSVLLGFASGIGGYLVFFFGLFYTISVFYFSKDLEFLISLPLKGYEILCSKFLTVLAFEYITTAVLFIPFTYFGIREGVSAVFYLYMVLVVLLLPIIPLCLASIIIMIVMRFAPFARNKDLFMIISSTVIIALAMVFNIYTQKLAATGFQMASIENQAQIASLGNNIFPLVTFSSSALAEYNNIMGIIYLFLFILSSIAIFVLMLVLGEFLYIKSASIISSSNASSKKLKSSDFNYKRLPLYFSLIKKDFLILLKTPVFLLNNLSVVILIPLIFSISLFSTGNNILETYQISSFLDFNNDQILKTIVFAAAGLGIFCSGLTCISSTAISREGSSVNIMKIIPVSYFYQSLSKCAVNIITGIFSIIAMLSVICYTIKIPLYLLAIAFIIAFISNVFFSISSYFFDLISPKLHWTNEQQAVKQNLNSVFSILLSMALAACFVYVGFNLPINFIASTIIVLVTLISLTLVAIYALYMLVDKLMAKVNY